METIMKIEDMLEYDSSKGLYHYKRNILDSIIECLSNPNKLHEMDQKIRICDGPLSTHIAYFYKLISYFPLTKNVVEFGFGSFPLMSFLVDYMQQLQGSGTITAYDENFSKIDMPPLGNIDIKYEYIKKETCLDKCDLLFGIYPCYGTLDMIDKANSLGVDFFLVLCDCYPDYKYFFDYARKGIDNESEIIIDSEICKTEPIIIKRKKIYN